MLNTSVPPGVLVSIEFGQGAESHSSLVERGHQVHQVLHASSEPVELPHHHGVALAQQVEHMVEFGTVGPRAGGHVGEDPVAPGPLQRVPLQISGLVAGADPRVPVDHARHMTEPYHYPSMALGFGTLIAGRVMGRLPPECRGPSPRFKIRSGNLRLRNTPPGRAPAPPA